MLLASEAYRRVDNNESRGALLTALDSLHNISRYVPLADQPLISSAVSSQDGSIVLVRTPTEAIIVDGDTLRETGVRIPADVNTTVKLSLDGREVATATSGGVVRRFATATGKEDAPQLTVAPGMNVTADLSGVPIAYLGDERLAIGDASLLDIVAPGHAEFERRLPTPAPIIRIDGGATGRYLFLGQDPAVATGLVFDDTTSSLREPPVQLNTAGLDDVRQRMFASEANSNNVDLLDLKSMMIVKSVPADILSAINWTVLPDGSSFVVDPVNGVLHHFDSNFAEQSPVGGAGLGQVLSLTGGQLAVVVGDGIGLLDLGGQRRFRRPSQRHTIPTRIRSTGSCFGSGIAWRQSG